ncbi:MAG: 1-deoxy-D-xylulose-5-phosphate synthase [Candidatus Portiera sp.]|nr:1-deoxy-D-xylulose-5-phosphate synthase [Portiera sp.]
MLGNLLDIPQEPPSTPLLEKIDYPHQLKKLNQRELLQLAQELRQFILYSVGQSGGHLGAGLGVIELTIALHYVFDTPNDKIIWDVGHQAYPHKILTGRRKKMNTIRQQDGLAPFPCRTESEYDVFGTGHSSTSISAALGMAEAAALLDEKQRTVAVIGDGAMTAGMSFEALNNAGDLKSNLIVILNDNSMSISNNVGALSKFFGNFVAGKGYINLKELIKPGLDHIPKLRQFMSQTEEGLKHMFLPPSAFFETLGFNYTGILDGHDLGRLVTCLDNVKDVPGMHLLHIKTCKGKGLKAAEDDPIAYHALTKIDPVTAKNLNKQDEARQDEARHNKKYTEVFSEWLCDAATTNDRIVALTPAMREGSGLVEFSQMFPKRYYDVGIAEQHCLTMAAGMACSGLQPIVAIYSTFLQRAYDQLIHDIALQNLSVVFAIDRSGLVGGDGATHNGSYDISYLRCIPNMTIMTPSNEQELYWMLNLALEVQGPVAVRYPRGEATGIELSKKDLPLSHMKFGKAHRIREGDKNKPALVSFGYPTSAAKVVAEELDMTLVDMRFAKPLDEVILKELAESHGRLVTLEENATAGGAGSGVMEFLASKNISCKFLNLGLADKFVDHGEQSEQRIQVGLSSDSIITSIKNSALYGGSS